MRRYTILQEIGGRFCALWGLILFIITVLIASCFYVFCFRMKEFARAEWHRKVSRVWMNFYMFCIGCPVTIKGAEHFKKGENYIIVCNHNSMMDVPVTTPYMPGASKTIGKKEFTKTPLFGWIYALGSILVDRKSEESRRQSYNRMKEVLKLGLHMIIYPEGTRNKTNEPLKPFYDGAFKLAEDTGKSVMPAVIFNTRRIMPPDKIFFLLPHSIEMHFLAPHSPEGLPAQALKTQVFETMKNYYAVSGELLKLHQ